jgi:putative LysE/RhtB family amino acid efflux pump
VAGSGSVFLSTFAVGLAVAMPVGAMGVLCIERTLARGWTAGVATGLGIATADAVYASVAAFGVTAISTLVVQWHSPLRLLGGVALVAIGLRALASAPVSAGIPGAVLGNGPDFRPTLTGHGALYLSALALTLANPMTIIAFAGVFMGAGLAGFGVGRQAVVATVGVALGSLAWWLVLAGGTAALSRRMTARSAAWVTRISGMALAAFGLVAIGSAFLA